jgi:hypothetical protein
VRALLVFQPVEESSSSEEESSEEEEEEVVKQPAKKVTKVLGSFPT